MPTFLHARTFMLTAVEQRTTNANRIKGSFCPLQVLSEVERVHPPMANASWREASTDVELGGYSFKKGTRTYSSSL